MINGAKAVMFSGKVGERRMELTRKAVSGVMLTLLFIGMLTLAFDIQPVRATGTIYIRADGTVDPPTAPISSVDNVTYTFTGNIYEPIVVERDNIIVDGNGYTLQGAEADSGFSLVADNVTIRKTSVQKFRFGIAISSGCTIINNVITYNVKWGIYLGGSNNKIISNRIASTGLNLGGYDIVGIYLGYGSDNNTIADNHIEKNGWTGSGILLYHSSDNTITGNNITNHDYAGIYLDQSSGNIFYHNNFVNNYYQVYSYMSSNTWDKGYPSGGNYWSDYTGIDEKSGPNQDQPGSDGIGDTPYTIVAYDRYPLMNPWPSGPGLHELEVTLEAPTLLPIGSSTLLEATVRNNGFYNETNVSLFLFINSTMVNSTTISLLKVGASYTISYLWAPTIEGIWNVTAYAPPVPEETFIVNNLATSLVSVFEPVYTLTITVTAGGTTNPAPGSYLYGAGTTVPVTAIANTYYSFDHWELDGSNVGSANPYSFLMDNNHTLHGVFVPITYTLTITATAGGTTNPSPGVYAYAGGSDVQVTAIPDSDYVLDHWELDGANVGANNPINVTMDTDHALHAVFVSVLIHDVAVTDVTPSKTVVGQGYSLNINVTVVNQGDFTESFNVTVFYNATAITLPNGKNHTTITLTSGNSTTITITWNTTGIAKGNYTISAYAEPVPDETDTTDNIAFADKEVCVAIPGDVDGDKEVTILDVVKITGIYASKLGDPQFNPNSDIDNDGVITILDVVICTSHYGQKDP